MPLNTEKENEFCTYYNKTQVHNLCWNQRWTDISY